MQVFIKEDEMVGNSTRLLKILIAHIDNKINQKLNIILHASPFQQLEASWRGLLLLIKETNGDPLIEVKILSVTLLELNQDILNALEFDQSQIFKKVYTHELDQAGGLPFGLLIGDYYLKPQMATKSRDDVGLLKSIAKIAAAALTPFISAIDASFFGLDQFSESHYPVTLDTLLQQPEYTRWHGLRGNTHAHFIGLTLPRVLMRSPYNTHVKHKHRFFHEETVAMNDYLWGNAAYLFACSAIKSFRQSGWFTAMKAQSIGHAVTQTLPEPYPCQHKISTETVIPETTETHYNDHGFMVLHNDLYNNHLLFHANPSIKNIKQNQSPSTHVNAKISSMLPYLLCATRFAHYVKLIIRNKIGTFIDPNTCETLLQNWLLNYCAANSDKSPSTLARYPLSEANVSVKEQLGTPGRYDCILHLKPHYPFDTIQPPFVLTTTFNTTH